MPLFSIIIPVYNAEAYIQSCLNSVLAQSESSWEAICVDDGSSDNSYQICTAYAASDNRFRIFRQKNAGAAAARNFALENANGEYLIMLDADDSLPKNALSTYFQTAKKFPNADCVFASAIRTYSNGNTMGILPTKSMYTQRGDVKVDALLMSSMSAFCWGKLYKKSIISEHNIRFDPRTIMCEDYQFNLIYLSYCNQAAVIDDILYLYRMHGASSSAAYHQGTADLSMYTSYVAMIPRTVDLLSVTAKTQWKKELYRKNVHLCFSPASITKRMPWKKACHVWAGIVKSQFHMMRRVSPLIWLEVLIDDVKDYFNKHSMHGSPFDNPSAHL